MIPLQFGLFWAGAKLSYLRYLTFASLRHFNPKSDITLYVSQEFNKGVHSWDNEKQDFEDDSNKDYLEDLEKIGVRVEKIKAIGDSSYCVILQADLFRWLWMRDNGGFYLDTDQIVMKSFENLPLDNEFIYSRYMEPQCGDYCPTGVLGLEKGSKLADIAIETIASDYSPNNYNSSGPFALRKMMRHMQISRSFNAPQQYFYPVHTSADVWKIYEGIVNPSWDSVALHWYGGHLKSQDFNKKYTEEFAKTSRDWISKFCRENKII